MDQDANAGSLEARYRRLLRALPASYRSVREQEMVDTFLQSRYDADPDLADVTAVYGWPGPAETVSVLGLALRLRWGGVDAPARYRVRTAATRTFALLGLLMLALLAVLGLQVRWGGTPWWPSFDTPVPMNPPGAWETISRYAAALWIPALLFVVFGRPRVGQILAVAAVVPLLVDVVRAPDLLLVGTWATLLVDAGVIVAIGAFRRDTPPVSRRPWLITGAAGILALQTLPLAAHLPVEAALSLDGTGLWCFAAAVAAVVLLVPGRRLSAEQGTGRLLAVAIFALVALLLRAADTADVAWVFAMEDALRRTVLVSFAVQSLVVAAIGGVAAVAGIRRLHRMPAVSYSVNRLRRGTAG